MTNKSELLPGCEIVANVFELAARCGISKADAGRDVASGKLRQRYAVPSGMVFETSVLDARRAANDVKLSALHCAEFHEGKRLFRIRLGAWEMTPFRA